MGGDGSFRAFFIALTGHEPFPWQQALYEEWFSQGRFPSSCNLPTGLGKTNVIAVWLIALANGAKVPRRLVYVVNRRTVVDQTTSEAEKLRQSLVDRAELRALSESLRKLCANPLKNGEPPLAISTLRGQFADNREWSADPSRPAVICGTVDMIGSRLLFSGYRIGFKSQPLHAGFLGQDALLVHDEAHLEPAFQKLITDIEKEQERERKRSGDLPWPKLRVMQLTATTRNGESQAAGQILSLEKEDEDHPVVKQRIEASKHLQLHPSKDNDKIAEQIADLALKRRWVCDENVETVRDEKGNLKEAKAAVLVFVRSIDDVKKVYDKLTSKKDGVPADHVQQLTGTMRGLERDRMADPRRLDASRVFARFLRPPKSDAPENERWKTEPMPGTVYLVCTSAGEVGIDISADHMVCDLSTFESMAQRMGRVNRYGDRDDTRVDVLHPNPEALDDKKPNPQRRATLALLKRLPELESGVYDASPRALGELQSSLTRDELKAAFAPEPIIPQATDILFDVWALTTIKGKMPGRPEVAPYLHGIADDLPQTTITWRTDLDLIDTISIDGRAGAEKTLQTIFSKHRIRPHETLTVGMSFQRGKWKFRAIEFLEEMVASHSDLRNAPVAIQFLRNLRLTTVGDLIDKPGSLNSDPTLILPASFGGLDDKGTLAIPKPEGKKKSKKENDDDIECEEPPPSLDIADAEGYEREKDAKPRMRILLERSDDGWFARAMPGAAPLSDEWNLEEPAKASTSLVRHLRKKSRLSIRLVQAIAFDDEGDPFRSLVCLSPASQQKPREEQPLADHVAAVESEAQRLADALKLKEPFRSALLYAAKWHDEGKNADRWQRYIGGPDDQGRPLGKSAEWRDPKLLAGYRHEFGSLLRIRQHLPDDEEVRELALHLIAAHHGYARPHFENTIDPDFTTQQSDELHIEVMRRYARLQRKYGRWGLAYLESLLRAADWAASAAAGIDPEVDDDTDEASEMGRSGR